MNEHERITRAKQEILKIIQDWFGEELENMEDEFQVKKYLIEPLNTVIEEFND